MDLDAYRHSAETLISELTGAYYRHCAGRECCSTSPSRAPSDTRPRPLMPNWRGADIPRFFRAPDQDAWFPAQRLVSSLIETLRGLGIEASQHRGVTLGIERRPRKSPRAF